ncbi:MAG: hypothetical protein MI861_14250, partial [Pirellulales bacterium]|nr:hypothetical protein [Pirellulales bacterium]
QGGTIREQTKLAGSGIKFGDKSATGSPARFFDRPPVNHSAETRFQGGWPVFDHGGVSPDMIGVPETEIAFGSDSDQDKVQIAETPDENLKR